MTTRKGAPRREVLDIERVGDWGEVTYRHRLACGHVEVRKRPSPARVMGCEGCVLAGQFQRQLTPPPPEPEAPYDPLATAEVEAQWLQAGLAGRLGVDLEAVNVVMGPGGLRHAVVVLDRAAVEDLLGRG